MIDIYKTSTKKDNVLVANNEL